VRTTRIWADEAGESHFEGQEVELQTLDIAPPATPFDVSAPFAAERALLSERQKQP
jgi:hypothetical protein